MIRRLRSRMTYANTVATLALFLALGGSSYAAISVTGKNVKNSSLTGKDVKNSSLSTSDVKNGSLLSGDFKSGQLPQGAQGAAGPAGPAGPVGATGPIGATGPAGTARAYAEVERICEPSPTFFCLFRKSSGVTEVTRPVTGEYCIEVPGISSQDVTAVASPEFTGSGTMTAPYTVQVASIPACPNASDFGVNTYEGTIPSNSVAFTIVIP